MEIEKSLIIEPMEIRHLSYVLGIEKDSFPSPWSPNTYMNELTENSFAHYFVCFLDEELVAYIGLWIIMEEAHITTIAVTPKHRGKRIAEKLINFAIGYAKIQGAKKMVLEVRVSNFSAQKLYKRMDFYRIGLRREYYSDNKEDAIVMLKNISQMQDQDGV
ncbi:MAG: ribosomal protein S18-alanine N-acetyltransferase [Clostridia bacterium]|nr:ribosomal protein S18-alanine N-acetyltransferase [Clostridia bacterium]